MATHTSLFTVISSSLNLAWMFCDSGLNILLTGDSIQDNLNKLPSTVHYWHNSNLPHTRVLPRMTALHNTVWNFLSVQNNCVMAITFWKFTSSKLVNAILDACHIARWGSDLVSCLIQLPHHETHATCPKDTPKECMTMHAAPAASISFHTV
jgi:hypothetical protein